MRSPASPYARYTPPTAPAAGKAPSAGPASSAKPIETASELRQVLTAEERNYFEETASLGSLWYGRDGGSSATPAPVLGQQLDVRG